MKKSTFIIKKWLARGLVVAGALIGVTACHHSKKPINSDASESLSSSATSEPSDVSPVEDVYGPPSYFDDQEAAPTIVDEQPTGPQKVK